MERMCWGAVLCAGAVLAHDASVARASSAPPSAVVEARIPDEDDPPAVDGTERTAVVERIAELLSERFYDAERGAASAAYLRERLREGAYDALASPQLLAETLTNELRPRLHDRHFVVSVRATEAAATPQPATTQDDWREAYRRRNFDFSELRLLEGNVGYLRLRTFAPARLAGDTAAAAMRFLANADAVIIDLRGNRGGYPDLGLLIASYFFERRTHYANVYRRVGDRTEQQWTQGYLPGPRLATQGLFILVGRDSFSGAESLAYNLQALGRATVVGERTDGGATGVDTVDVNERFEVNISDVNFTSPVTGSNWEGGGVKPDIACPFAEALYAAHLAALDALAEHTSDPARQRELAWARLLVEARMHPVSMTPESVEGLAGVYGDREVWCTNDVLQSRRGDHPIYELRPIGDDVFMIDGAPTIQLRFVRDPQGKGVRIVTSYADGSEEAAERKS